MKFCPNCGRQLDDSDVFCDNCGSNVGSAAPAPDTVNQPVTANTYQAPAAPAGGAYYQAGAPGPASAPPAGSATQGGGGYYQTGATPPVQTPPVQSPAGQSGPYYPQGTPQGPYMGAPAPHSGSNKLVIVIIAIVAALALIGGGVFLYSRLAGKNNPKPDPSPSFMPSIAPSAEPSVEPSVEPSTLPSAEPSITIPSEDPAVSPSYEVPYNPGASDWDMFDWETIENIEYALEDIGIDPFDVVLLEEYDDWYGGLVYTFEYEDSVFDMFLRDDGTVFSIETGGVQLFIDGFESYDVNYYLGYTTHYDESYPDNGYIFYLTDTAVNSTLTVDTSYDLDYVIELFDAYSGNLIMAYYIQSGQIWSMAVPAGDYIIQYAAGPYWYNTGVLFGDATYCFRADYTYTCDAGSETSIVLDIFGGTGIPSTEIDISEF